MAVKENSTDTSYNSNSFENSMNRDGEQSIENCTNSGVGNLPQEFHGEIEDNAASIGPHNEIPSRTISRTSSVIERVHTKLNFFSSRLKDERRFLAIRFLSMYLIMGFFILGIFSIYWGAAYGRNGRLKNLKMLVIIEDDVEVEGINPVIGNTVRSLFDNGIVDYYGDWHIYNSTEFQPLAERHNNTVEEEMRMLLHHQKYWASIYVKANASYNLYNAIINGDTSYNTTNNTIMSAYETGRDIMGISSYVVPSLSFVEQMWLENQNEATLKLIQQAQNKTQVFSNDNSISVLAAPIPFNFVDYIPWTEPVLVAPSQVGLIYMIIVTFFQVNIFLELHQKVARYNLKPLHYILYRYIGAVASYFFLSLFYSLVTLAMQVDFTVTFGKSGFLVYWMLSFLTMWAVGSANELIALLVIPIFPPLLGFWLLFWVLINVTPTFTPLALSPKFFRYSYGLPIHNSAEATKVIFFNTYKGELGRNYGIIVAWIVIITILYPFGLKFFGQSMAKKAKAQAAKVAEGKE